MICQANAATAAPAALKPLVGLTTLSVVTAETYPLHSQGRGRRC